MHSAEALLEIAARLADQAGHAIMAIRAHGFEVRHKEDRSPVTVADTVAEAIILDGLRETGIPVVAEEMMSDGAAMRASARYWLVDPLDGTKEFAKGLDEFVVCIGLIEEGYPRLGVLALPVEGSVVGGLVGEGVCWKQHGERRAIRARPRPSALTVLDSRSHPNPARVERILAGHTLGETRNMGSAMKFAVLAEGLADVIPRPGTTMEWDSAAGQAVVEAAGGRVTDMAGERLAYGKPDFRNAGFIAWGAPAAPGAWGAPTPPGASGAPTGPGASGAPTARGTRGVS